MSVRRNSYGPQMGETLQSFIFRVLQRVGVSDFSTVLTTGGWGSKPSVPLAARKEFEGYDKKELLRIFEANITYHKKDSVFRKHFEHLEEFENGDFRYGKSNCNTFRRVFYPLKASSYAGKAIMVRYCHDCILQQIEQRGFAFFKAKWATDISCGIHLKPLFGFGPGMSISKLVVAVKQVLRGDMPQQARELTECDFHIEKKPYIESHYISFAPCAKAEIIDALSANCRFYPSGYNELIDYGVLTTLGKQVFSKWQLRRELNLWTEKFYEIAIEHDYDVMIEFIKMGMEIVPVKYIGEILNSDIRWLLRSKTTKCSRCAVTRNIGIADCPASQLIHFQPDSLTASITYEGPCDMAIRYLSAQVSRRQRDLRLELGERSVRYQEEHHTRIRKGKKFNATQEFLRSHRSQRENDLESDF